MSVATMKNGTWIAANKFYALKEATLSAEWGGGSLSLHALCARGAPASPVKCAALGIWEWGGECEVPTLVVLCITKARGSLLLASMWYLLWSSATAIWKWKAVLKLCKVKYITWVHCHLLECCKIYFSCNSSVLGSWVGQVCMCSCPPLVPRSIW